MDESGVKNLVLFLDMENPDLWKWLTDQEKPPETVNLNPVFVALREKVMNNLNNHAAPETRAAPGQRGLEGGMTSIKVETLPLLEISNHAQAEGLHSL
ncbi:succinate dehydrogenase assembly factor 2, mitochondrial-like [Primulina eburnea]|uniref:succinate dehydrogenase assembly factor 2, mitochondrial-like n=1 Tax=Primulina eburnea TaxID=1245227 RepID=UPI003C6CB190